MAFWGVELKPGKPFTHHFKEERGRLHVSQATLGAGSTDKKTIVECKVGDKKPIYLCSLLPEKLETCPLNLEFEEDEDVTLSVIGSHSVHLSGFFYGESDGDEYGSDLYEGNACESDSETDDSMEFDYDTEDEDDDGSTDDDFSMYPASPLPNSGVIIEEIVDDEKQTDENGTVKRPKKKKNTNENSDCQIVVKSNPVMESEDEDGFPISAPKDDSGRSNSKTDGIKDQDSCKKAPKKKEDERKGLKRNRDDTSQANGNSRGDISAAISSDQANDVVLEKNAKKNKKKKRRDGQETVYEDGSIKSDHPDEPPPVDKAEATNEKDTEKKKKNKKKKKQQDSKAVADPEQEKKKEIEKVKNEEAKHSKVRTFGNGLVIEELAMGKPDGKRAAPGKKVGVRYIGKLQKGGKIFDSNIGQRSPFEFRLGVGQVIKGWDVGVNGMRVGDKRRITIPPAMGYGARGADAVIPPNSWLVFDVELLHVK